MRRKRRQLIRTRKRRIFMTGATGFFGKSMFMHLPELKEWDVVLLSRNPGPNVLQGDVRNFEFPDEEFDYIYHGAATSGKIIPDAEMESVIIDGTKRVIEFAKTQAAKFMFVSSGAVYGMNRYFPVREDTVCEPTTVYGKAKLEAEKMVEENLPYYCIARCFAFVGEYLPLDEHFAIGNFIRDCLENSPIIIKGDGTAVRSYMYAGDLAQWLWKILLEGQGIYNVGSDNLISILDTAQLVRQVAGTYNNIQILQEALLGRPPLCYAPQIDRVNELGLKVLTPITDAILKTINFHRRKI